MSSCLRNTVQYPTNANRQLLIAFVISCKIKLAMARFHKRIEKSNKYKYVALHKMDSGDLIWVADLRNASNNKNTVSFHKTEKEAAMAIDLKLIEFKKEPINILKRA